MSEFRASKISQRKEFDCINEFDKNKSVLFYTINNRNRYKQVRYVGALSYLMSYEYIRKSLDWAEKEMLPEIVESKGVFMTDSGAFSLLANIDRSKSTDPKFWEPYIEEYIQFLYDNCHNIYCAANMDLDRIVGREAVDEWNERYFKPLEKYMQIVYVVHPNEKEDVMAFKRLKEYCNLHDYVGIASGINMNKSYPKIAQISRSFNTRLHGFGYTVYNELMNRPMFSIDSSTWTMGSRFGETHIDDGANYRPFNRNYHHYRKKFKHKAADMGLDYSKISGRRNKDWDVNVMNLHGWLRFNQKFTKISNRKLRNKPVMDYWKPRVSEHKPDFYVPIKERKKIKLE